jgi:transketolase
MRDTFVKTLLDIAKQDSNVHIITGDLGFGVLKPFWEQLPNQITNVGIAEQNMTGFATGMALEGKIVFTYSIGNFPTLRTLEQIRNDAAYHNANVKIVCVGGGFVYGSLGMSHHATEDIAIMRALPNVKVFAPADPIETEQITRAIYKEPGTCYLRLGRGGEEILHHRKIDFKVGRPIEVYDGENIAIFSTGAIANEVVAALDFIVTKKKIGFYTFPTIKPYDLDYLYKILTRYSQVVTIEEHVLSGGFGSSILEVVSEMNLNIKVERIGINDLFASVVGSQKYLRNIYKIDKFRIIEVCEKLCKV